MADKFKEEYIKQSENTGTDVIRGVKDWYMDVSNLETESAILKCQEENVWWDKKLSKTYNKILTGALILIFMICVIVNLNSTLEIFILKVLSALPIILMIINEFILYFNFNELNKDISVRLDVLDNDKNLTKEKLEVIQRRIYKRRLLNYGAPNILHKLLSVKFHKIRHRSTIN